MKITASIVTYNNQAEIRGVLNSLLHSDCADKCTVYVVDNGSIDDTISIVEKEYPTVNLIKSKNVGYGAGNNKVINHISSDYHFVINPDITFMPSLISDIIAYMDQESNCILCTPEIVDAQGCAIASPKRDPRLRYIVARFLPFQAGILQKWRDEYTFAHHDSLEAYPIDICSGCFMAMRTKTAQLCGGFDEQFFLYYEDFDLSRHMKQYGQIMCLPFLQVVHNEKRSAYHTKTARNHMMRSLLRYFHKWGWKL